MSDVRLQIPEHELKKLDKKLAGLGMVSQSKVLLDGMRAAGRAVRKRGQELAPAKKDEFESAFEAGIISDSTIRQVRRARTQKKKAPLKTDTAWKIKAFLRRMEPVLEVRVKAAKRAPHFHLVELGHEVHGAEILFPSRSGGLVTRKGGRMEKKGKRTKPTRFLSRGGKYSQPQQRQALNDAIVRSVKKIIGA